MNKYSVLVKRHKIDYQRIVVETNTEKEAKRLAILHTKEFEEDFCDSEVTKYTAEISVATIK